MANLLARTNFKTAAPMADHQYSAEQQENQVKELIASASHGSLPGSGSHSSLVEPSGQLNKRYKAQERDNLKATGTLNVPWGSLPVQSGDKKNRARAGNSLLDAVDRSEEPT